MAFNPRKTVLPIDGYNKYCKDSPGVFNQPAYRKDRTYRGLLIQYELLQAAFNQDTSVLTPQQSLRLAYYLTDPYHPGGKIRIECTAQQISGYLIAARNAIAKKAHSDTSASRQGRTDKKRDRNMFENLADSNEAVGKQNIAQRAVIKTLKGGDF